MTRALPRLALCAALLLAASVSAAETPPARVALVRPAHPDAATQEAATRVQAELLAAGFVVVLVDAAPGDDARAQIATDAEPARPVAAVAIVHADHRVAADVWIADRASRETTVRRVDVGATAESSRPAALAIRAVELLRASLLEIEVARARPAAPQVSPAPAATASPASPPAVLPPDRSTHRALLAGPSLELGLSALYGLGDTGGRLAPTLRFTYGAPMGLAGRVTLMGPTATDQLGIVELAYGFDRSFRRIAPVVSLGAGAAHTHLADSGQRAPQVRAEAWSGVLAAAAGVAARPSDRAAILFDLHAFLADPAPGAIVGGAPAAGRPQLLVAASLGVLAGF
jgi:hypothetical protein